MKASRLLAGKPPAGTKAACWQESRLLAGKPSASQISEKE
jgi:hypothetical protein